MNPQNSKQKKFSSLIFIRGGGDIASGVAIRLHRAGFYVVISELEFPLTVRRTVSFSEAVFMKKTVVEDIEGILVNTQKEMQLTLHNNQIPVIVDPDGLWIDQLKPGVIIDGRMLKVSSQNMKGNAPLTIGLGPGFTAGVDCDAVVETKRGHFLGRVYWQGSAEVDTGVPEKVAGYQAERVLRSPKSGIIIKIAGIGDHVDKGQMIARVDEEPIIAIFSGVVRGLIHSGASVRKGMKIGDIDPRDDPTFINFVSDKALAVGGGVLEAIMHQQVMRNLSS